MKYLIFGLLALLLIYLILRYLASKEEQQNAKGIAIPVIQEVDSADPDGPKIADDFMGIKIVGREDKSSVENKELIIRGVFRTYVKCGSQYATWYQFPETVQFTLKNLDTNEEHTSRNTELSISPDQRTIERYSSMPCDQIHRRYFEQNIFDYFTKYIPTAGSYEIFAFYKTSKSEPIRFDLKERSDE